jgi:cytochrome c oxidase cbb3-type subunit 3
MANCAACHGAEGKGNPALGAPNLADKVWLYGSSPPVLAETIGKGRGDASAAVTRMPAHKDLLGAAKIRILTAYVWGFSNNGSH